MVLDRESLRALRRRLQEVLGEEDADTLMEFLPGRDVATGAGLRSMEQRTGARFTALDQRLDGLDQRLDGLDRRMDERFREFEQRMDLKLEAMEHRITATFRSELVAQTRTFALGTAASVVAVAGLAFAAARIT